MTRFATVLGLAGLCGVVAAADPTPHDVWDGNGADGVERVTQFFKMSRMSVEDRSLFDQIWRTYKNSPGSNLQQVAEKILKDRPDIDPKKWKQFQEILTRQPGVRPPVPKFPPTNPWVPPAAEELPPPVDPFPPKEAPPPRLPPKGVNPEFPGAIDPGPRPRPRPGDFPQPPVAGWQHDDGPNRGEFPAWRDGPEDDDPLRKDKKLSKFLALWEKNFGPITESPAFRSFLLELVTGADGDPGTGPASGLLDLLNDPNADGEDVSAWLDAQGSTGGWDLPDLGLKDWDFGGWGKADAPDVGGRLPSTDSAWFQGSGSSGSGGSGDSWLSVILFVAAAAGALVAWRYWPYLSGKLGGRAPRPLPGLGPWPVDPRSIADRDGLVKAFEYLSVLVCGTGAKVWNHVTIATALGRAVGTAGEEAAEPLARLYAAARYTPADEPLPPEAFAEARRHLSRLAGVAAP